MTLIASSGRNGAAILAKEAPAINSRPPSRTGRQVKFAGFCHSAGRACCVVFSFYKQVRPLCRGRRFQGVSLLSVENPSRSRRTILLAEDDGLIRMVLAEALREPGYRVIEAKSGDEALTVLEAGTSVDLLVTDVRMPGQTDGIALAQKVRQDRPGTKIIIAASSIESLRPNDVDGIFEKPYAVEDVVNHANRLLAEPPDSDVLTETA
ncbi:MAG: response regulator [Ferrovibrio sp.]